TEDITCPTIANIYMHISNLAEVTSELSTNIQELIIKLFEFQINQEKANTEFLTILNKIQNQIKKLENSKYSTELDHKLSQIANTIGEKITKDVEVIASDMTGFVNEVVNKAFDKVMSEINKSTEKVLNEVEDDNNDYIDKDAEEVFDCTEDGRPAKRNKKKSYYLPQHLLLNSNPSKLQENIIALCHSQHHYRKSVAQTEKVLELTFSHPFKDILKILQIDCTSPEISEDKAEASPKKHERKK
ncbi:26711_t:CDS:2, partial [Dentiscutata erythropus]